MASEVELIYADGSCLGNPGPGGWAWARVSSGSTGVGSDPLTTNQRMELTAVLEALRANEGDLVVRSDSSYVVRCFLERWWTRWRANDFRNAKGQPVANADLWRPLIGLVVDGSRRIEFEWVKGHADDPWNAKVDRLAREAALNVARGLGR